MLNVLACQIEVPAIITAHDKALHINRVADAIEQFCSDFPRPDLVVLPELSTIECSASSFELLDELSESLHGYSFKRFSLLAKKLKSHIAYGFPRKNGNKYFICHAVISPKGECIAYYDKIHIAQIGLSCEQAYFSRGDKLLNITIKGFKISLIICYDFRFPELTNLIYNRYQPDLIIHPVAFPQDSTFANWHHVVICRAIENQSYFLSLNRAGGMWGHSICCPPWINDEIPPTLFSEKEEFKFITLNKNTINEIRKEYPFHRDKLDTYSQLK